MFRLIGRLTDRLTSTTIEISGDGRTTVYPWGSLGRGYVANAWAASMLVRYVKLNIFVGPLVVAAATRLDWFLATVMILAYLWLYVRLVHRYARFMEPVDAPISGWVLVRRFAPKLEAPLLAANLAIALLSFVTSVTVVLKGSLALGLFCMVVSGMFFAAIAYIAHELRGFEDAEPDVRASSVLASIGQMR